MIWTHPWPMTRWLHLPWKSKSPSECVGPERTSSPLEWRSLVRTGSNTGSRHAFSWTGDTGSDSGGLGMDLSHHLLRLAHVESLSFCRNEHCHGPDHLGGHLDELRGPKHRPNAVQSPRLHVGSERGPTGRPRPHHHLHRGGHRGTSGGHGGRQVHQLRGRRVGQGPGDDRRRRRLHCGFPHPAHPRVLVRQQHHHGVLQPADTRCPEEGDRGSSVPGLGCGCLSSHWRRHPVLQLSATTRETIRAAVKDDVPREQVNCSKRLWQERLRLSPHLPPPFFLPPRKDGHIFFSF